MVVEKIIRILKKDPNYKFSSELSLYDTSAILLHRASQIARGLLLKPFVKSTGLIFVGTRVKLRHKNNIRLGKNAIIEDNVHINAFSKNGFRAGNNVSIARDSIVVCSGVIRHKGVGVSIGNNTGINARAYLGGQGGIEIGDSVIIGPDVKIFSENHIFDSLDIPIKDQGESRKGVKINNNCWIGAGAIILDGVEIGEGCVVAAGSVVTKSFPRNSVIGGIPAKTIKMRDHAQN